MLPVSLFLVLKAFEETYLAPLGVFNQLPRPSFYNSEEMLLNIAKKIHEYFPLKVESIYFFIYIFICFLFFFYFLEKYCMFLESGVILTAL